MTPEARAARERKQKLFVVVGGLLLLGLLAFQLPKLLGGSSSPETAATTTVATPVSGQPAVGTTPTATPAASGAPVATAGKITSFGVFSTKDPFVQQAVTPAPGAEGSVQGDGGAKGAAGKAPATGFTTAPAAPAQTVVTVNGARQVLDPGKRFPKSDPLFVLVATSPKAKTARIGVAGGAYSSGDKTTTLKVGKPLTLVNTATGAKYKIVLVSVGTGETAGKADSQEQP